MEVQPKLTQNKVGLSAKFWWGERPGQIKPEHKPHKLHCGPNLLNSRKAPAYWLNCQLFAVCIADIRACKELKRCGDGPRHNSWPLLQASNPAVAEGLTISVQNQLLARVPLRGVPDSHQKPYFTAARTHAAGAQAPSLDPEKSFAFLLPPQVLQNVGTAGQDWPGGENVRGRWVPELLGLFEQHPGVDPFVGTA